MASITADALLEHFHAPRNAGTFPAETPGIATGRAGAVRHGREIQIQLQVDEEGRITACRYRVYGCPATIALCSLASERLPGMTLSEAGEWRAMALAEELALPAEKRAAVLVLEDAVRAAVRSYNMSSRPASAGADTGRA
ncbi:MAG: iron-sulfur cluster assembly scaffold protein [Gammaproteobacteria bacterium]